MSSPESMTGTKHGSTLLPFYICIDVSYSMAGSALDAAEQAFTQLIHAVSSDPLLADIARVALLSFSDTCEILIPLTDPLNIFAAPALMPESGTSYGVLFTALRKTIESDLAALKADGNRVYRPVVYILTDGAPTDADWRLPFKLLTEYNRSTGEGNRQYPFIVPLGFGRVDRNILAKFVNPRDRGRYYIAAEDGPVDQMVRNIGEVIFRSVIASVASFVGNSVGGGLILPEPGDVPGVEVGTHSDTDWI